MIKIFQYKYHITRSNPLFKFTTKYPIKYFNVSNNLYIQYTISVIRYNYNYYLLFLTYRSFFYFVALVEIKKSLTLLQTQHWENDSRFCFLLFSGLLILYILLFAFLSLFSILILVSFFKFKYLYKIYIQ